MPDSRVMTIPEAAKELRLGVRNASLAAQRGEIPTIRIGRRLLVPRAALNRMLGEGGPDAPKAA